jgi:hypothetical protein
MGRKRGLRFENGLPRGGLGRLGWIPSLGSFAAACFVRADLAALAGLLARSRYASGVPLGSGRTRQPARFQTTTSMRNPWTGGNCCPETSSTRCAATPTS